MKRMLINTVFFILVSIWITSESKSADSEVGSERTPKAARPVGQFVGVEKCALCHSRDHTKRDEEQPLHEILPTDYVRLTEVSRWRTEDKHAKAYTALSSTLGIQISNAMGISGAREPGCVSCHGTLRNSVVKQGPDLVMGVTCENCHGPAGRWWAQHSESTWRTKTTSEKQQLDMVDVRDPAIRAKQCFSCHIGNPAENKIITHEMYAAGHPPLRGVEIESLLSRMPAHWRNLSEKNPEIRNLLRYDANEKYRTKSVLIGGVLAYREWLNYLSTKSPSKSQGGWTDFAVLDCYSCHHDLKDPKAISWRQERGFSGVAGRAHLAAWPQALVKLAIFPTTGGNTDAYNKKVREFNDKAERVLVAHNTKAFPIHKTLSGAKERDAVTSDLLLWLDRLATEIQGIRFDNSTTVRLMQMLAGVDAQDRLDYSSARQIGGALASLFQEAQFSDARRKEIGAAITDLKATVGLEVKALVLVNDWQAATSYDPQRFYDQLSRLAQLLK